MRGLATSPFALLSPKTRDQDALRDQLDDIIERLQQQREMLEQHLSLEARGAKRRRLKIDIEVARLQLHKALAMRSELPQR